MKNRIAEINHLWPDDYARKLYKIAIGEIKEKACLNGYAVARQVKSFFLFYELVLSQAKKTESKGPLTLK